MGVKHQLVVTGHFKNLARIADFVTKAAVRAGLGERAVYAVQMAVDEACANIIEHAYGGEGKGQIRLTYQVQTDGLKIVIFDQGEPFDPAETPELNTQASLPERVGGGMGMFFIRRLVDHAEYKFNTPQGNQLTLFIRREHTS